MRGLVDEFEASGLERAQFCRKRDLALSTLGRHLRARRSATVSGRARLVAVSINPRAEAVPKPGDTKLEVVLGRGHRIGVRPDFDTGTLRELLLALEGA